MAPNMNTTLKTIAFNFGIATTSACLPKTQHPDGESDAAQWGDNVLKLLETISAMPTATVKDFRTKLKSAIKSRQERNKTAKGKVKWMTVPDLKVVLATYQKEEKSAKNKNSSPIRTSRRVIEIPATPSSQILPDPENLSEVNSLSRYENSSAPVAFKAYFHHGNVKAKPVNLNPDASVAAKPRGRKRGRNADDDEHAARPSKRPSLVHEDNDPRGVDDTGFISVVNTATRPKRTAKRLSRLEQGRVRIPHWQDAIEASELQPHLQDHNTTPTGPAQNLQNDILPSEAASPEHMCDNDDISISMDSVDLNALKIPEGATTKERLEFHRMRRRIWYDDYMVRMLKVQVREEDKGAGVGVEEQDE